MMTSPLAYLVEDGHICLTCYNRLSTKERADLEPIFSEEDLRLEDGSPNSCDVCLGWVADVNAAYNLHPLATDISSLTIACGDSGLTRILSEARHIALDNETEPKTLVECMTEWAVMTAHGYRETVAHVVSMAAEWAVKWRTRKVLKLKWRPRLKVYTDPKNNVYRHRDTFGYLDVLEVDCDACGRCVFNECYESDDGYDTYCPDCVVID